MADEPIVAELADRLPPTAEPVLGAGLDGDVEHDARAPALSVNPQ